MSAWLPQLVEGIVSLSPVVWILLGCLVVLGLLLWFLARQKWTARLIAMGALSIAAAFLLSYVRVYHMPQGGSITPASMLPIMAYGWVFGPGPGVAAGLVYGLLQFIQEPYFLHPAQFMMDFIFPFAALGLTGFFRRNLWAGAAAAGTVRFFFHFLSGIIFWSANAPEGQPVALYSLIYNGSYMLPEILICLVVVTIPAVRRLFRVMRGPDPRQGGSA